MTHLETQRIAKSTKERHPLLGVFITTVATAAVVAAVVVVGQAKADLASACGQRGRLTSLGGSPRR